MKTLSQIDSDRPNYPTCLILGELAHLQTITRDHPERETLIALGKSEYTWYYWDDDVEEGEEPGFIGLSVEESTGDGVTDKVQAIRNAARNYRDDVWPYVEWCVDHYGQAATGVWDYEMDGRFFFADERLALEFKMRWS